MPAYDFESITPEAAAQALADAEGGFKRIDGEFKRIDREIVALGERIEVLKREREQSGVDRESFRKEGKRLAHIIAGLCRETIDVGQKWYPVEGLCPKRAKDGFYCGIHAASRKRREANRAKWSAEVSSPPAKAKASA